MAWLEIHQSIKDHRKLLAAADALDMAPAHIAGHIIFFWLWALDNAPSGEISDISARNIARAAQWEGKPEDFLSALIESGLVDQIDGGLFIHDWADYAGKLIDQRIADRERKRQSRAAAKMKEDRTKHPVLKADSLNCPEDVQWTSGGQVKDIQKMSVATVQNSTLHNSTGHNTRESNGGAPSCDEDISLDSNCNQMSANVPVNVNENENVNEERKTRTSANGAQVSDGFYRFWEAYPRKINKKQALDEWNKIRPDAELADVIITGVERWKQSKQWTDDDGQYIPYPDSFLSKERWKDEVRTETKKVPVMKNYDDDEDFLGRGGASP